MNILRPPRISSATYVVNFRDPDPKIRLKQAQIEAAFSGLMNRQSQQTNIPDEADPSQPRIVFQTENKTIFFTQVSVQLTLAFEDNRMSAAAQLLIIKKNVLEFYERLLRFMPGEQLKYTGLVYDIVFPSGEPLQQLHAYLFDRFYKMPSYGTIASSQFNVGFDIGGLYLTLSTSVYETRSFEGVIKPGEQTRTVDILDLPITDYGILVKVDLNDRPRHVNSPGTQTNVNDLFEAADNFMQKHLQNHIGFSLEGTP